MSDASQQWTHLATLDVTGRPSSPPGPHRDAWQDAIREAVEAAELGEVVGSVSLRVEFRLAPTSRVTDSEDLQTLLPVVVDALDGVFGTRLWAGEHLVRDERLEHVEVSKRLVEEGEEPGAEIEVWSF